MDTFTSSSSIASFTSFHTTFQSELHAFFQYDNDRIAFIACDAVTPLRWLCLVRHLLD